jgi:hypothetical protein
MRSTAYYIKTSILALLLFIESLFLTHSLLEYIVSENYFFPEVTLVTKIAGLLLAILYTQALTAGAWHKNLQLLIVPFPLALGVAVVLLGTNNLYAQLSSLGTLLLMLLYIAKATHTMELLIKFRPKIIMVIPTKGVLFVFSFVAAALVLVNPKTTNFDLGEKIGEIANTQVKQVIEGDAAISSIMQFGMFDFDIEKEVSSKVNDFIEPYKNLLTPLIAVLVFAMVRSLGAVVSLIYGFTVEGIFWFARKLGFFNVEVEQITRERLSF